MFDGHFWCLFLPFVSAFIRHLPHVLTVVVAHKSVPTLRYTFRHGPIYTCPCPKTLTECSPLDFRRSSIYVNPTSEDIKLHIIMDHRQDNSYVMKTVGTYLPSAKQLLYSANCCFNCCAEQSHKDSLLGLQAWLAEMAEERRRAVKNHVFRNEGSTIVSACGDCMCL